MGKTIDVNEVMEESLRYVKQHPDILNGAILSEGVALNKYARTITKVKGEYPVVSSMLGHVVQGFQPKWTPMGKAQMAGKLVKSYKQKVNFEINPAEVLGTWLANHHYKEGAKLKEMPISKYILEKSLGGKITSDVNILSMKGINDPSKSMGDKPVFGYSMDGLSTILRKNSRGEEYPYFKIPLDTFTDDNIWDQYVEYDKALPKDLLTKIPFIACSHSTYVRIKTYFNDNMSKNKDYTDKSFQKSPINEIPLKKMHGLPDGIFVSWAQGNLLQLVDLVENPAQINKIIESHYTLQILGEFTLGYEFSLNQFVILGSSNAEVAPERGLGNKEMNELYFPEEFNVIEKTTLPMI